MKKLITLSMLTLSTFMFSQTDYSKIKLSKSEIKLKEKLKKSYYFSQFPYMNLNLYAIKYNCLKNKYQIDIENEKEFLNKEEFLKNYNDWNLDNDNDFENRSILQEGLNNVHYNYFTKKHEVFPKCLQNNR